MFKLLQHLEKTCIEVVFACRSIQTVYLSIHFIYLYKIVLFKALFLHITVNSLSITRYFLLIKLLEIY